MLKEPYVTPEIKSEELEAGALGAYGSPGGTGGSGGSGGNNQPWLPNWANPSCGFCCET